MSLRAQSAEIATSRNCQPYHFALRRMCMPPPVFVLALALSVAAPSTAGARQSALFSFHSHVWINLHHYLHALTRPGGIDEHLPSAATSRERQHWNEALNYYRTQVATRSLLFDEELIRIKQELAAVQAHDTLDRAKLSPALRTALEGAAPVYRKYFWKAHAGANERFLQELQPLLDRHGPAIAKRLAATYDAAWPAPIRVDLVHDAGPPGNAYTISEPTLITIGVSDPRHRGHRALEIVFHEASHRWDAVLMDDVRDAARRLNIRAPGPLWHALLFYNAGAITTDVLASAGIRDYRMYMSADKTFDRPGWHEAVARHWPAFLNGEMTRAEAIGRVLRDLFPGR